MRAWGRETVDSRGRFEKNDCESVRDEKLKRMGDIANVPEGFCDI